VRDFGRDVGVVIGYRRTVAAQQIRGGEPRFSEGLEDKKQMALV
jgi:hypothetical protein